MAISFSPRFLLVGLLLFSPLGLTACAGRSGQRLPIGCEAGNQPLPERARGPGGSADQRGEVQVHSTVEAAPLTSRQTSLIWCDGAPTKTNTVFHRVVARTFRPFVGARAAIPRVPIAKGAGQPVTGNRPVF